MTGMITWYFLAAPEGLRLENMYIVYSIGALSFVLALVAIGIKNIKVNKEISEMSM